MSDLCQCGCGGLPGIAKHNDSTRGYRKGERQRFMPNHHLRGPRPPHTPDAALAKYVTPGAPGDCWIWQGGLSPKGYGIVSIKDRQHRAHRVAYEVANGPIPPGLVVRHDCDNPPCVNPAHLLIGTHADNQADKVRRRRQLVGEQINRARLTAPDVVEIRARYAAGETVASIARDYSVVTSSAIESVVRRKTWKHVKETA